MQDEAQKLCLEPGFADEMGVTRGRLCLGWEKQQLPFFLLATGNADFLQNSSPLTVRPCWSVVVGLGDAWSVPPCGALRVAGKAGGRNHWSLV